MSPAGDRCLECHFTWEEEELFPRMRAHGLGEIVDGLLAQHAAFRRTLDLGQKIDAHDLQAHASFEEEALAMLCLSGKCPESIFVELIADHDATKVEAA